MSKYNVTELTLKEKIGQLLVFGFDALDINDHALNLIKNYKAGNIILFARNVKTPEQVFTLNQNLQKLAKKHIGIPLFITIDQEGGMVTRIKNGATFFPGAMTLGATNNSENSYLSGKYMGEELKALGINMNLAPVLDVNNNPYNPVIGIRSYSDQKEIVADHGVNFVKGLQENVIATAKHFPGHGDTKVDSHLALPNIHKTLEEITDLELVPFQAAIDNGIKAIMSSHINFPNLTEKGLPTTLSRKCLTGLLREQLQFKGLIITDCMQMKAIQRNFSTPKAVVMAINAGANLACVSHSEEFQTNSLKELTKAVETKELSIDVLNERVQRILDFKSNNISFEETKKYQDIEEIILNHQTKEFTYNVVKDAFTLVKGTNIDSKKKTLLIASEPLSTTIADEDDGSYSIIKTIAKECPHIDTLEVHVTITPTDTTNVLQTVKEYEQVLYCSYNANVNQSQIALIDSLESICNLTVIMMRNPYDSIFASKITNLLAMFEYTPNSIKVLVEYLKGTTKPKGKIPVRL